MTMTFFVTFLNGVCRHEQPYVIRVDNNTFLNGVCRHEQKAQHDTGQGCFLNGVCRHELLI